LLAELGKEDAEQEDCADESVALEKGAVDGDQKPATAAAGLSLGSLVRFGGAVPPAAVAMPLPQEGIGPGQGGDKYAFIEENDSRTVKDAPLSTFSIDVDTASYAKTRAYLLEHHALPSPDAVRIEELINYFRYDYPQPEGETPFSVTTDVTDCPWNAEHRLQGQADIELNAVGREQAGRNGRMLAGHTVEAFWTAAARARPFSVGLNCSSGARAMRPANLSSP
jgi:hypothetical protein